jgi:hypothetical protein
MIPSAAPSTSNYARDTIGLRGVTPRSQVTLKPAATESRRIGKGSRLIFPYLAGVTCSLDVEEIRRLSMTAFSTAFKNPAKEQVPDLARKGVKEFWLIWAAGAVVAFMVTYIVAMLVASVWEIIGSKPNMMWLFVIVGSIVGGFLYASGHPR